MGHKRVKVLYLTDQGVFIIESANATAEEIKSIAEVLHLALRGGEIVVSLPDYVELHIA